MAFGKWDTGGELNWADDIEAPGASNLNTSIQGVAPPIGSVMAWLKSYTNTPSIPTGYVECNGQVLSDANSPLDGKTMPSLNVTQRFIRGSTTSGSTGGADSHTHAVTVTTITGSTYGAGYDPITAMQSPSGAPNTTALPPYYEVVYIVRVK